MSVPLASRSSLETIEPIERELLRANVDDPKHHDQVLLYEESLSRAQRRRVLGLNTYGRKIERLMDALLRL